MTALSVSLKNRLSAAGIHFAISMGVAAAAAWVVFAVWYPYPYREISGGRELFFIVVAVDVIMGPLLTFTVFDLRKPRSEIRRDLGMIGVLQLAALAYGLWTVAVARPVHLVFEIDRFRVVHAIDINTEELKRAPPGLQSLPWNGPTLLSTRAFTNDKEGYDATLAALKGLDLGARPFLWQDYEKSRTQILQVARPLADLKRRFPAATGALDAALPANAGSAAKPRVMGYVPMASRDKFWTVLLDLNSAEVIAFVPIDSF